MARFLFGLLVVVACGVEASAQGCVGKVYASGNGSHGGVVRSRVSYGGYWGGYRVRQVSRFRRFGLAGYGSAGHSYGSTGVGVTVEVPAVAEVATGCGCGCPDCTCGATVPVPSGVTWIAPRRRYVLVE